MTSFRTLSASNTYNFLFFPIKTYKSLTTIKIKQPGYNDIRNLWPPGEVLKMLNFAKNSFWINFYATKDTKMANPILKNFFKDIYCCFMNMTDVRCALKP
jgi:hypothetical protein